MELLSNLVWIVLTIFVLGKIVQSRRRPSRLSLSTRLILAGLICLMLLPVVSITDDMLQAHQALLPLSGQSWRLSAEDASTGLELGSLLGACLLLLVAMAAREQRLDACDTKLQHYICWLTESQRLRPPPCAI